MLEKKFQNINLNFEPFFQASKEQFLEILQQELQLKPSIKKVEKYLLQSLISNPMIQSITENIGLDTTYLGIYGTSQEKVF